PKIPSTFISITTRNSLLPDIRKKRRALGCVYSCATTTSSRAPSPSGPRRRKRRSSPTYSRGVGPAEQESASMTDEIADKIIQLIAAIKRIPKENVTIDSTFEQLGVDSLDAINLIYEIESDFNISVPDEVARSIKDVRQLLDALKTALAATPPHTGTEY